MSEATQAEAPAEPAAPPVDPLADARNRERLEVAKAFAFHLLKGIKQIGMYRHNDARYGEYLQKSHEAVRTYTDTYGPLTFKVEQQNFLLFDQPLFPEETNLPFKFWRDGIRQFIFRQGLRLDELVTFTLVALSDVDKQGEDTVAQLWRAPLDHLEYVVVEGFHIEGFDEEAVKVEIEKIINFLYLRLRSHSDDFMRFARVTASDLEIKMEGVEQVRGAVIAGETATDDLKAKMQREIAEEENSRLFPKLVAGIFQVAETGVDDPGLLEEMFLQLLDALLLQEDFATINQIVLKFAAMEDRPNMGAMRELKQTFLSKMGEEQRLTRIGDVLRTGRVRSPQDVARYLLALHPSVVPSLLNVLETVEGPEHRVLLCDVIAEFAKSRPADVVEKLSSERPQTVRDMVYILEKAQVQDRLKLFARVLRHKNLAVRLEVMSIIARGRSNESRKLIAQALKDENVQVRMLAARLLPEYDRDQAYLELLFHIRHRDFRKRTSDERASFYTALGSTGIPAAVSLMQQMLAARPRLWNRRRVLDEKLLAVHGLAGVMSIQSYKALQLLSDDHSQPPEVLSTARRALAETRRALFGDAPAKSA
ncbi:MAG: HEAT repeat domain-containing protein [Myxococcaceae bacterium]